MTVNSRQTRRRALACGAAGLAALLVAACGGSGEPTTTFRASRVIALGDESSLIVDTRNDANGSKYSVNATVSATDQTLLCGVNAVWSQSVAASYGLFFPQCNPPATAVAAPTSRIRAALGARSADLGAQIDAQQAESPLGAGDMVTVLVGEHDVIAEYQKFPAVSVEQLIANVEAEGAEVGRQVNRITDTGAKVLLSTIVDVGLTPYGFSERAAHADTDRAAVLTQLSQRFNASMRATIVNDGRRIGLILLDELVRTVFNFPGFQGFSVLSVGVCDLTKSALTPPSSLDCTPQTLVTGGGAAFFWADDLHLSAAAQNVLGSSAITRAQNNPF
jgi:phospholipase/lecithinase/hemolysin